MHKKVFSVVCLALMISILFTGCFATIEGKWKGQIDFTAELNRLLAESQDDSFCEVQFVNIFLPITMEFTADGKCTFFVTDADVEMMVSAIVEQLLPVLETQMTDMGISLEEFAALSGLTKDEMMQRMVRGILASVDLAKLNATKSYKVEDGIVYLGDEPDSADALPYTLNGNQLTLESCSDEDLAFMFPLTLKRVRN